MRLTALILGLLFCAWISLEGLLLSILSDVASAPDARQSAASFGFFAGFLGLIAAAFVMAFPLFSAILFVIAGFFSLGAAAMDYPNHWVYMVVLFGLALLSFFGWRGKVRDRRERAAELQRQTDRDNRMEQLLRQQHEQQAAAMLRPESRIPIVCPGCGHQNAAGTKYCAECGTALAGQSGAPA